MSLTATFHYLVHACTVKYSLYPIESVIMVFVPHQTLLSLTKFIEIISNISIFK